MTTDEIIAYLRSLPLGILYRQHIGPYTRLKGAMWYNRVDGIFREKLSQATPEERAELAILIFDDKVRKDDAK